MPVSAPRLGTTTAPRGLGTAGPAPALPELAVCTCCLSALTSVASAGASGMHAPALSLACIPARLFAFSDLETVWPVPMEMEWKESVILYPLASAVPCCVVPLTWDQSQEPKRPDRVRAT